MTPLLLNQTIAGAFLVLGTPLAYRLLLECRYPQRPAAAPAADVSVAVTAPAEAPPTTVESLGARRARVRAAVAPADRRIAA